MQIVKHPNKILHQKLKEVKEITLEIRELILAMRQKMVKSQGVGLAANQIGIDLAIFVVDKKPKKIYTQVSLLNV